MSPGLSHLTGPLIATPTPGVAILRYFFLTLFCPIKNTIPFRTMVWTRKRMP